MKEFVLIPIRTDMKFILRRKLVSNSCIAKSRRMALDKFHTRVHDMWGFRTMCMLLKPKVYGV